MRIESTAIPGCLQLLPVTITDSRGSFTKYFSEDLFATHGMALHYAEEYVTVSRDGVLRGLHFQVPPHDHAKLIRCIRGSVLDAVVDLRVGSPTFGKHALFQLREDEPRVVYVPEGLAHGFCVLDGDAAVTYHVTTVHSPAHDKGIRWDSAGIDWPRRDYLVSARDAAFPPLADFESPFRFADAKN